MRRRLQVLCKYVRMCDCLYICVCIRMCTDAYPITSSQVSYFAWRVQKAIGGQ